MDNTSSAGHCSCCGRSHTPSGLVHIAHWRARLQLVGHNLSRNHSALHILERRPAPATVRRRRRRRGRQAERAPPAGRRPRPPSPAGAGLLPLSPEPADGRQARPELPAAAAQLSRLQTETPPPVAQLGRLAPVCAQEHVPRAVRRARTHHGNLGVAQAAGRHLGASVTDHLAGRRQPLRPNKLPSLDRLLFHTADTARVPLWRQ
jgi:hypothetical protein